MCFEHQIPEAFRCRKLEPYPGPPATSFRLVHVDSDMSIFSSPPTTRVLASFPFGIPYSAGVLTTRYILDSCAKSGECLESSGWLFTESRSPQMTQTLFKITHYCYWPADRCLLIATGRAAPCMLCSVALVTQSST